MKNDALPNDIVTEDSAAQDFVDQHGDRLRYCHSQRSWFRWNGAYWIIDGTGLAFHWARKLARRLAENQTPSRRYITSKTAFASGVERFAKTDPAIAVEAEYWDRDIWLLGTPKGTIDLRTGQLRPPSPDDGITKITSVVPDANAPCPRWKKFLMEVTGGDADLIRFLKQWFGYCLTGSTREEALVFIFGPGGNGKTKLINVVIKILNAYAVTSAMETLTASFKDRHPTELAMLKGARLVTASETDEGRPWAEAKIKHLTGGDRITARFLYKDFFEYDPQFKFAIVGNHKPILQNVDDAHKRRINIVPFLFVPIKPDKNLEVKLMSEASAILHWMIEGCLDWQKNGLMRPQCVIDATTEYFEDQDCFQHWLNDACDYDPNDRNKFETSSALFRSWSDYAKDAGMPPGNGVTFKERMTRAGFKHSRDKRARRFFGIKLREQQYYR